MNITNESSNDTPYDMASFCTQIYKNHSFYWELIMPIFSVILNFACMLVFIRLIRSQRQKDDLFKYFLAKSIVDTYLSAIFILNNFFNNELTLFNQFFLLKQLYLIFGIYFSFALQLTSMFLEVASSFNRYRMLTNTFHAMNKISYKLVIFFMFAYSFMFYVYKFYEVKVQASLLDENNVTVYMYASVSAKLSKSLGYVHSFVRDGICVLVIIVLNVLTVYEMRKMILRKKILVRRPSRAKAARAETRLTLMVLTISSISIVAHGLLITYYMSPRDSFFQSNTCFEAVSFLFYSFSYEINFFLYYFFNTNFKNTCNMQFVMLLRIVGLKKGETKGVSLAKTSIKCSSLI